MYFEQKVSYINPMFLHQSNVLTDCKIAYMLTDSEGMMEAGVCCKMADKYCEYVQIVNWRNEPLHNAT